MKGSFPASLTPVSPTPVNLTPVKNPTQTGALARGDRLNAMDGPGMIAPRRDALGMAIPTTIASGAIALMGMTAITPTVGSPGIAFPGIGETAATQAIATTPSEALDGTGTPEIPGIFVGTPMGGVNLIGRPTMTVGIMTVGIETGKTGTVRGGGVRTEAIKAGGVRIETFGTKGIFGENLGAIAKAGGINAVAMATTRTMAVSKAIPSPARRTPLNGPVNSSPTI